MNVYLILLHWKNGNFLEQKSSLPIQVLFFSPQYWDRTVGRLWEVLGWDTEGCSELTIVTTISCCFLIELQQLKLSAAWPGIKLTGFENIVLITSLYINLYFQFYFYCLCFALNSSLRYNRYFSISVLPYTLHKQCHS